jgi:uncharacterized protein
MSMTFEWDEGKASDNVTKHGVSFAEASTVFADPLSRTIPDPSHSDEEDRFIILGESTSGHTLVVVHTHRGGRSELSARGRRHHGRGKIMSEEQNKETVEILDEYDFSQGVVGKYAKQYAEGTNLVLLDPDVAKVFPNSEAVNQALRAIAQIIQQRSR